MESDLILPIFWTIVISTIVFVGIRRLKKKAPTNKLWIRQEEESQPANDDQNSK